MKKIYLYGMIHARYIITIDGLEAMVYCFMFFLIFQEEKYSNHHFGTCSRVYCNYTPLLPVGISDSPNVDAVKLFCPCCKEIYNAPSLFDGMNHLLFFYVNRS